MSDPVLVEVTRGDVVESVHRGAVAVFDFDGRQIVEIGNTDQPVFPRSAVKTIQALPLIETGAADAMGFSDSELALACASHSGEREHVDLAHAMLRRSGLDEPTLECGSHWPSNHEATLALARENKMPTQLHNNCSGKHAGFLSVCSHCGFDHRGYVAAGHPFQEMVRQTMEEVTGAVHNEGNRAIDGCSIPTYAVPLKSLALGFARMGGGKGLPPMRAAAAKRLLNANMAHPFMVAGTGRADTEIMRAAPGRIFVKTGAEGVYCGVVGELGLAFALKCDDGATRGAEVIVSALLQRLLHREAMIFAQIDKFARQPIQSRKGAMVGTLRPSEALMDITL